jgi:tetratricopeptide (TPR) repeat protein
LEKKFARHVQVWRALVFADTWNEEQQIRRLRKCIELSHDFWAYQKLAAIYHQAGKIEEWLAVLDEFLAQPSRGLEHDHVRAQIAGHYMLRHEWEKALPYALEAAQSWAAWAMVGAADCYEGLNDDENEGLWRTRLVERYPSKEDSLALYFWARRSGLGNAPALARVIDGAVSEWAKEQPSRRQHQVGVFYQLSGRPALALAAYQKAAKDRSELRFAYTAQLRVAVVAQELGNASARDEAIQALTSLRDPALASFEKTGAWIERELTRGEQEPPDLASARALVAGATKEERPAFDYAIGRFLELRGRIDDAIPFLDSAASSAESHKTLSRFLASAALRDRGATPSKLKTEPIQIKTPPDK